MKLELKTENEKYSNLFSQFIRNVIFLSLIIIVCDVSLKLGNISKHYQIKVCVISWRVARSILLIASFVAS